MRGKRGGCGEREKESEESAGEGEKKKEIAGTGSFKSCKRSMCTFYLTRTSCGRYNNDL